MRALAMTGALSMPLAHGVAESVTWTSWTLDPPILASLVGAGWLYARGVRRMWAGGRGRGVRARQVVAFYSALVLVAVALLSPLEALAGVLVSGHMAQHLILLVPAPALLVYAAPGLVMTTGVPAQVRRPLMRWARAGAVATGVLVAVTVHSVAMWIWHLPGPYESAVSTEWVHALEHASFLGTALLFWALVIQPRARRRVSYPAALLAALVVWVLSGGLGALLTFSAQPLYPVLGHHAGAWGMSALADQQLAGVVMWVPAGFSYLIAMAVLFVRWMDSLERRMSGSARAAEAPR